MLAVASTSVRPDSAIGAACRAPKTRSSSSVPIVRTSTRSRGGRSETAYRRRYLPRPLDPVTRRRPACWTTRPEVAPLGRDPRAPVMRPPRGGPLERPPAQSRARYGRAIRTSWLDRPIGEDRHFPDARTALRVSGIGRANRTSRRNRPRAPGTALSDASAQVATRGSGSAFADTRLGCRQHPRPALRGRDVEAGVGGYRRDVSGQGGRPAAPSSTRFEDAMSPR